MMHEPELTEKLKGIQESLTFIIPELTLGIGILLLLIISLFMKQRLHEKKIYRWLFLLAALLLVSTSAYHILHWPLYNSPVKIFSGMLGSDTFSAYLKILFDIGGLLTLLMSMQRNVIVKSPAEYIILLLTTLLGAHLLVMSLNFVTVFLSLELISLSSYVLAGFSFHKKSAEGSLKYFLFGSVASAVMLYGFTILYGLTGALDFSTAPIINSIAGSNTTLLLIASLMALTGFLFKISAVPMHPWAPDIYEAAPMPIVAFFSVVPKLAGIGVLTNFMAWLMLIQQETYDWQYIISIIALATLTVGNFSALWQTNAKRMMAYSSIAQTGFLMIGIASLLPEGINFMLFYATVYLIMNFLVFLYLAHFESNGIHSIPEFAGVGKVVPISIIALLIGLISLTGLPPTGGFMGKLFIFSSLWKAYVNSDKSILLWLFIVGLLNTVVSLFYYLRIPYYAFLKKGSSNIPVVNNIFPLILVFLLLLLFFQPNLLMGWINNVKFVLDFVTR